MSIRQNIVAAIVSNVASQTSNTCREWQVSPSDEASLPLHIVSDPDHSLIEDTEREHELIIEIESLNTSISTLRSDMEDVLTAMSNLKLSVSEVTGSIFIEDSIDVEHGEKKFASATQRFAVYYNTDAPFEM